MRSLHYHVLQTTPNTTNMEVKRIFQMSETKLTLVNILELLYINSGKTCIIYFKYKKRVASCVAFLTILLEVIDICNNPVMFQL